MREARHSSAKSDWMTPQEIIDAARDCMGDIDLDPASSVAANSRVQARRWFGPDGAESALDVPWWGRVFLNPPGGKTKGKSNAVVWWRKLAREWSSGTVSQAIFVGFSIEILQTTQLKLPSSNLPYPSKLPLDFPICVPKRRLAFCAESPETGEILPVRGMTHASVIVYLPPWRCDLPRNVAVAFKKSFSPIGRCR